MTSVFLLAALVVPALMVIACVLQWFRARVMQWLWLAPLPALIAAITVPDGEMVLGGARLDLVLRLDAARATLLGAVALLWSLAGAFAAVAMRGDPRRARFGVVWLLSLTGCIGVFLAGDLTSFYLLFSLVSLSAYGLVVHDRTDRARRAASIYLVLAVLGEAFLLIAFIRLAADAPGASLQIDHVVATLADSSKRTGTIVLLMLGFGVKMGLLPLHAWLPIAHPAAPTAASAVLSGAIIKTGVIGLILFLPAAPSMAEWSTVLMLVGFATAFYGAVIGATQSNPKTILAYSSVSQMGVTAAIIGAGLTGDIAEAPIIAAFYALHHVFVKGALFLGTALKPGASGANGAARAVVVGATTMLALSFAGLPLTGGAIAKLATSPLFPDGAAKLAASLAGAASALVMLRFLREFMRSAASKPAPLPARNAAPTPAPPSVRNTASSGSAPTAGAPRGLVVIWAIAAAVGLVAPWALVHPLLGIHPLDALAPAALWSSTWPILIGAAVAIAAAALVRSGVRIPAIPEGDMLIPIERVSARAGVLGHLCNRIDTTLATWSVAGVALLGIAALLMLLLQISHS